MSDDYLPRIEAKLDKATEDITDIKVTLAEQHVSLQEHMRRSSANEKAVDAIVKELKPIQAHVIRVQFIAKLIVILFGGMFGIMELISYLHH